MSQDATCTDAPAQDAAAERSLRVVLADDHGGYRIGLARAIAGHGRLALAEAVRDGTAAVQAVARHKPDIALLDVRMPGLDGLETARRLRESGTAIILLSGHASPALTREAESAGAVALLSKELSRREICARLVELA
ncbi:MAG TPA: response regulator transcription factor [Thermoleophilaceae bacterium]|nr:response regulator transcription factor [Thermoleophilaceae bacterium]